LVGEASKFDNRAHFFGAAAEAMRHPGESARRKDRLKHGGQLARVNVETIELPMPMPDDELLALDEALGGLTAVDARAVVKLCFCRADAGTGGKGTRRFPQHNGAAVELFSRMAFREMKRARNPSAIFEGIARPASH
jgi:hypothetical protein